MKHCTLPTLLAVKTTILPTVPSSRAGQKRKNSETGIPRLGKNAMMAIHTFNKSVYCHHMQTVRHFSPIGRLLSQLGDIYPNQEIELKSNFSTRTRLGD